MESYTGYFSERGGRGEVRLSGDPAGDAGDPVFGTYSVASDRRGDICTVKFVSATSWHYRCRSQRVLNSSSAFFKLPFCIKIGKA